jgi:hypothetical protein
MKPSPLPFPVWVCAFDRSCLDLADAKLRLEEAKQQKSHQLALLVSTSELAEVLGCSKGHASDLRSGNRQLPPGDADKVIAHVRLKTGFTSTPLPATSPSP